MERCTGSRVWSRTSATLRVLVRARPRSWARWWTRRWRASGPGRRRHGGPETAETTSRREPRPHDESHPHGGAGGSRRGKDLRVDGAAGSQTLVAAAVPALFELGHERLGAGALLLAR